jgi:hypothetical protein
MRGTAVKRAIADRLSAMTRARPDFDFGTSTAHSPRPSNQMNSAVITCRKARAYPVAQCGTTIFGKRHAVSWRRMDIDRQLEAASDFQFKGN